MTCLLIIVALLVLAVLGAGWWALRQIGRLDAGED